MRKIHALGLALFAVCAFSAVAVSSASASEWLWADNGTALTASLPVDSEGTLTLEDMNVPIFGKIAVECTGTDEGVAEIGGKGLETVIPNPTCKTVVGSCTKPGVEALNLAWTLELLEPAAGEERVDIVTGTGGEPGYKVKCEGLPEDNCNGPTSALILLPLEDPLHIEFDANSAAVNCSVGGAGAGLITGLIFVLAKEAGHLLSIVTP